MQGDSLSASTWLNGKAAPELSTTWIFSTDPPEQGLEGTAFSLGFRFEGIVTQNYRPDCLILDGIQVACNELDAPLSAAGVSEGSWLGTTCVDAQNGGCDCAFDARLVTGTAGGWMLMGGGMLNLVPLRGTVPEAPVMTMYCVDGNSLKFGHGIDARWPEMSNAVFARMQ
jgi:hypothetical protein